MSQIKFQLKNNVFSYLQKHKKKFLPLALTPLIVACDEFSFTISTDDDLIAQGFTVHHSPVFGNDNYTGTAGADAIIGMGGNDVFNGLAGDDLIYGQAGNDIINAGTGADEVYGGSGNDYIIPGNDLNYDYIDGGTGNDTVSYINNNSGSLSIYLTSGNVYINSGFEDKLVSIENVDGGLNVSNNIYGNALDNILSGGNLADYLSGGAGDDTLEGLGGADILVGGRGSDTLTGGSGVDIFKFSNADIGGALSNDVITDFSLIDDLIDFSDLDFINNFTDVVNNMVQAGSAVEIFMHAFDDYIVTIENMNMAQLSDTDFLFV